MNKTYILIILSYFFFISHIIGQKRALSKTDTIKIGLLVNNAKSHAAQNASEMAINKANKKVMAGDPYFQLIVRNMEGPWGNGSKEAVNLIFEEKVWAIMGSHDARNAHLVEQVIAKINIPFLSAWASDPTLSQAFVPWYFSCVPNTTQQAEAFIKQIPNKSNLNKTAVVLDETYDSKLCLKSLLKEIKKVGGKEPLQLIITNSHKDFNLFIKKINEAEISQLILLGKPLKSLNFLGQLRENGMNLPIYGGLSLLAEEEFNDNFKLEIYDNITISTSGKWLDNDALSFKNEYYKKYNKFPGAIAAYAYDGMNLILESIKLSGFDRIKIQKHLAKINFKGVTGDVQFDNRGNRLNATEMFKINNGIPVIVEK